MDTTYLTLGIFLIGLGFLLLLAEAFLPAHGVLGVAGLAGIAGGIVLLFEYDRDAGLSGLLGVTVAVPAAIGLLLYLWPRTPMGRKLLRHAPSQDLTLADAEFCKKLDQLRGCYGKTVSTLKPSGVVVFDGQRVDSISEGMMIEPGRLVRCIDVQAGKVVVRPADRPNPEEPENALFVWRPDGSTAYSEERD